MKMNKKQMKKINKVILGALVTIASTQSFAQTDKVVKEQSLVTTKQSVERVAVTGVVTEVGTASDSLVHKKPMKGFANGLPLLTVMKQITPNGWIVKKNDAPDNKLDVQKPISWEGGKTWLETLNVIAKDYNLNALVNWNENTITISNATQAVVKEKKSIFELEGTQQQVVVSQTPNKVSDVAVGASEVSPVEMAVVQPTQAHNISWELSASKSLRDNVAEWAVKSGYRLVWTGEDYPVTDSRVLAGDFEAENGPIKQLSVDYGPDSRAQNPLSFQFYQNRTLVVENWMFEQTGYPQFNKKN